MNDHRVIAAALVALASTVDCPMYVEKDNSPKGIVLPVKNHQGPRVKRNDPCPCGSGKKSKKCCRV